VPVHTPDLPLAAESSFKLGLSLWNHPLATLLLELACLGGGLLLYLRGTRPTTARGRWLAVGVSLFLVALTVATPLLPPPAGPGAFAVQGLAGYALLVLVAWALERSRAPAPKPSEA